MALDQYYPVTLKLRGVIEVGLFRVFGQDNIGDCKVSLRKYIAFIAAAVWTGKRQQNRVFSPGSKYDGQLL
ncbi:MAG: hypothetical protein PQJ50_08240 [Spirochaetales bacterium]|nr:hypothetical protein [Spirochaetales bacterium]